ncbi:FAD-dependent oxidoreductase [Actinoplanes sp. NPDC051346]|uniref:NAD(P)/FAD-dependent oxidoreductase n=1 Tax=Actinoplanes sp. NPDC051346 TaxID=3155048 RepID=UPI0034242414
MDVVVVGAGIAGLACARELTAAGVRVRVLERDRVVGGRLASERHAGRYADIGAAYFVADDPDFAVLAERWRAAGLARPWTDTFAVFPGSPARGPMRWAAPGGLRSLAVDLARGLDVTLDHEVRAVPDDADAVVLAMPGPQALRLAPPAGVAAATRRQEWQPVLTAVLAYPERVWGDFHGAFVNDHPVLATVCDDGDRRGDRAPVLVAHSTPELAREHLADPSAAGPPLARAVGEILGIAAEPEIQVRRWTSAQPVSRESAAYAVDGRVWLAGDAFGRPRVQTAWLSGRAVAAALIQRTER